MTTRTRLTHDQYVVGWICALPQERTAAVASLDERHQELDRAPEDDNSCTLGRMGNLNVVIALLGIPGTSSAATVAKDLLRTFTSIRFGLMVGIGGGVPGGAEDIRLGDVVVSKPHGTYGGVVQYDFGIAMAGQFECSGSLNKPPMYISEILTKYPNLEEKIVHPGVDHDLLFRADYNHVGNGTDCAACDKSKLVQRPEARDPTIPVVHYGLIASGNQVMKDGALREKYRKELGILCFETEAAGLMDSFPCLVIRGVSNYSDSHKNDRWRWYATATAAAYAKELLVSMSTGDVDRTPPAGNVIAEAVTDAGMSTSGYKVYAFAWNGL